MTEPAHSPRIAVVSANTLTGMGLAHLLESVMPFAKVCLYHNWSELSANGPENFVHYFISPESLLQAFSFYSARAARVFLITEQTDSNLLPREFRRINPLLPESELVKMFLRMEQAAHGKGQHMPESVRSQMMGTARGHSSLTPRETEVLKEVARGRLNKEIADRLNISLTTVISHRKNLTEKLGVKTVSGLTIYAVMHGLLGIDDI